MADNFKLRGITTALVTPFTQDGEVDEEALREILRFQLKARVNGFYPLGTTGVGPAMEAFERKRVAEVVVEETSGRVPVIVQIGASEPTVTLDLARHAEKIGADAVASLTPFYYHPGTKRSSSIIRNYHVPRASPCSYTTFHQIQGLTSIPNYFRN